MNEAFPWIFLFFCLGCVALIAGSLLGYLIGYRSGKRNERFRQVKERSKRNKLLMGRQQKERYEYTIRIRQLEESLSHLVKESEQYEEMTAELDFYRQKLQEKERLLQSSLEESTVISDWSLFTLLLQMREDPVHCNLSRQEWKEIIDQTDRLFNHFIKDLSDKFNLTHHEQEICCLIKWNFSRKEQLAVFNNTSDALTKSKGRLKKKLGLDEKTELDQFIRLF